MILITNTELWIVYAVLWICLTLQFHPSLNIKDIGSDPEKHFDKFENLSLSFQ